MDEHLSLASRIVLNPLRAGLPTGQDNIVDLLVRVQAPDALEAATDARPAQAIALVIDRSGSMAGRPLTEARRCAEFVVSRLRPLDAVSVVQFDNRVHRLWPAVPLGSGDAARGAISRIHSGGNTNLHGGWLEGAHTLAEVSGSGLKRVILLSDGGANEGLTDQEQITAQCAEWAARGITTSTYGLGDNFNEELMVNMARTGGGNHYYGDTADDLREPFQQELDLLANLALRKLDLSIWAPDGLQIEMLNELPTTEAGWHLPDLAWGAEAWAIVRVTIPAGALPDLGDRLTILRVSVDGQTLRGDAVTLERSGLALPVMSALAFAKLPDDQLVSRRLIELAAADALSRMRLAADQGDWVAVDRLLEEASHQFAGNEWVVAVLAAMTEIAASRSRERMMKESMYSASRLRSRLSAKEESVRFSIASESVETPAYLRRKPSQGKGDS